MKTQATERHGSQSSFGSIKKQRLTSPVVCRDVLSTKPEPESSIRSELQINAACGNSVIVTVVHINTNDLSHPRRKIETM